jgi:cell volume regulation protein A
VRGDEAIPPRGSTRLQVGDRLHVLVRQESARHVNALLDRWHAGPIGRPPRPPRRASARQAIFSAWRWSDTDGDPARPYRVGRQQVVEQLRIRRDAPGGLWLLADGRYAVTGPVAAIGSANDISAWAGRRLAVSGPDERAWLQTVIGALAADAHGG